MQSEFSKKKKITLAVKLILILGGKKKLKTLNFQRKKFDLYFRVC